MSPMSCQILTPDQKDAARRSGAILSGCLTMLGELVKPGISTLELDIAAEEFIRSKGGEPGFKGYHGFPSTLCTSVNEECVHGIPSDRKLLEGDIVSYDCGVLLDGIYTDACRSVGVGIISQDAQKLLNVTKGALEKALTVVKAGIFSGDISATIQKYVEDNGCKPVQSLTGHGLGSDLHQPPDIPNSGKAGSGIRIPAGTLIAIEPIVSAGTDEIKELNDGWTICTTDGSLCAHFEHSLLVKEDGYEVVA